MRDMNRDSYLILGASSDIGMACIREIAKKYRDTNMEKPLILAHYCNSREALQNLQKELPEVDFLFLQGDLRKEDSVTDLIVKVQEAVTTPKYLLHFPAMKFSYMRYKELDNAYIKEQLDLQLFSFLSISAKFFPAMKKLEGSRVVVMLTSYVAQDLPPKFMTDYIVAKYALLGAVKAAAAEFGGKNLKVNAVSPLMMDTKFLAQMDEHIKEMSAVSSPLGRIVSAEEVAPFITRLLGEDCDCNGENVVIDENCFT